MAQFSVKRLGGVLLMVCLTGLISPSAATSGETSRIQIGVVNSLFRDVPEPVAQAMLRPMKTLIEAETGMNGEVYPGGDALHLAQQLVDDKVQLGVFHGFEFAWARQKFPKLQALVIAVNKSTQLRAHLIVRADSGATSLADLKGKTVSLPRFTREHVHLFLDRQCLGLGLSPEKFFTQVSHPNDIEDALDNVVDGSTQACVVDGVALSCYQQRKPGRFAKLKILVESEAFPAAVVAYYPGGLPDASLDRFRDGMINAKRSDRGKQMLTLCRMTGFERIPNDYEELLIQIAKAYPMPKKVGSEK